MSTDERPTARRMTEAARAELIRDIRADRIGNAAEYAESFAERYDLNPVSVRSTISRLRRQLGLLKRKRRLAVSPPGGEGVYDRVTAVTMLVTAEPCDAQFTRVAAAALLRYEQDESFQRAVDEQRPGIEEIYKALEDLKETRDRLPSQEREELAKLFPGE